MALPVVFKYGTRADFDSLVSKDEKALYFLTDTGEIYRGNVNLARGNHYEGVRGTSASSNEPESDIEVINRVLAGQKPVQDDIFVIKTKIAGEKYSYTSFVYDNEAWNAMDGNYDASNVIFRNDLTATAPIGVVTIPESGSATIDAAGKSLASVLANILAKEKNPVITQPSVSVKFTNVKKNVEVGTKVTPNYEASFTAGKYEFGPETGLTVKSWSVTDNAGSPASSSATGSFSEIVVGDETEYSVTATASYEDGAVPVTNINNKYDAGQIKAGSKSASTLTKINGYRSMFYGYVATPTKEVSVDSKLIRTLTNVKAGAKVVDLKPGAGGAKRCIVAVPVDSGLSLKKAILTSSMNSDITTDYKAISNVDVEGANAYAAKAYKVYVYEPAALGSDEVHQITIG